MSVFQTSRTPTPDMRQINIAKNTIFYKQEGEGPPLLLLHGWGASACYWDKTIATFASEYTCYAPELPGFGSSSPLMKTASVDNIAEVIIAFANVLDIKRFHLVGHSFGGAVATILAARYPERIHRLVLVCFATFHTDMEQHLMTTAYYPTEVTMTLLQPWLMAWAPWMMFMQCMMAQIGLANFLHYEVARPFFSILPDDENMLSEGFTKFTCMDYRSAMESAASLANPELRRALQNLTIPTLLIGTNQDRIILPSRIEATAEIMRNCRVAWMNNCGHLPMIEQPEKLYQILIDFLR